MSYWRLCDLNEITRQLWSNMFKPGSREPQARAFWGEVLDVLIENCAPALRRRSEQPPLDDALSDSRRKRGDIRLDAFISNNRQRISVIYVEVKTANAQKKDVQIVEQQARDACTTYINDRDCPTSEVYGMCVLGGDCRIFKCTKLSWTSMWRGNNPYDQNAYIDVSDPTNSRQIWDTLTSIISSYPMDLAGKEILYVTNKVFNCTRC